ncbi:MAG: hypothetical protein WDN30_10670 [Pararobbsia sp.]
MQDGKAMRRRRPRRTTTTATTWVVTQGLEDGDQVIVQGLQRVHDGQPVNASAWQSPAAASAAVAASSPARPGQSAGNK